MSGTPCAVIFDLDDTLFDCTGQLTGPARRRAADLLAGHTPCSPEDLVARQARLADTHGSGGAIRVLARDLGIPDDVRDAALLAYNRDAVETIAPFDDVVPTLEALQSASIPLACVTTGRPSRQRAKLERLGLAHWFPESEGRLVLHDPVEDGPDKTPRLETAWRALGVPADRTLVLGDKLDAEIAAGNRLGMVTVRLRHGRQKGRAPASDIEIPDHEVDAVRDILPLLGVQA